MKLKIPTKIHLITSLKSFDYSPGIWYYNPHLSRTSTVYAKNELMRKIDIRLTVRKWILNTFKETSVPAGIKQAYTGKEFISLGDYWMSAAECDFVYEKSINPLTMKSIEGKHALVIWGQKCILPKEFFLETKILRFATLVIIYNVYCMRMWKKNDQDIREFLEWAKANRWIVDGCVEHGRTFVKPDQGCKYYVLDKNRVKDKVRLLDKYFQFR